MEKYERFSLENVNSKNLMKIRTDHVILSFKIFNLK